MAITFELWQLITLASMLLSAFFALAWALLSRIEGSLQRSLEAVQKSNHEINRHMRKEFDEKIEVLRNDGVKLSNLERDFFKHLADMAVLYVRRDDYIRGQTVIEAKLDAIAKK